jgi:hypothetical protein
VSQVKRAIRILNVYGREPLIQQYIPFEESFGINLLVDKRGRVVRLLSSLLIKKNRICRIVRDLEKFFKSVKYFGLASPQFLSLDGVVYLMEINPRLSVYFYGLDFGANFPEGFHNLFIAGSSVKKAFKFVTKLPTFYTASKLYLKRMADPLPVVKSFEHMAKAKLIKLL